MTQPIATMSQEIIDFQVCGVVEAITAGTGLSEAERAEKADMIRTLILSLAPANPIELTLACQIVLFAALTGDAAKDAAAHPDHGAKLRAQAMALSRLNMRQMTMLLKLNGRLPTQAPRKKQPAEPAPAATEQDQEPEQDPQDLAPAEPGQRQRRQISASARRQSCRPKQELRACSTPLIDSIDVEQALSPRPLLPRAVRRKLQLAERRQMRRAGPPPETGQRQVA